MVDIVLLGPFSFGQYIYILGEKERSALPSAFRPDYPDEAKRTDHQALMAEDGGFTFHHELWPTDRLSKASNTQSREQGERKRKEFERLLLRYKYRRRWASRRNFFFWRARPRSTVIAIFGGKATSIINGKACDIRSNPHHPLLFDLVSILLLAKKRKKKRWSDGAKRRRCLRAANSSDWNP